MTLPTYLTVPVLDWQPQWDDPTRVLTFLQEKQRLSDTGPGPRMDDAPWQPRPRTKVRLRYDLDTREEMEAARDLVRTTLQGRRNPIWVPLWSQAVHLAAVAADVDTTITITRSLYTRMYGGVGRGREHVAVFLPDGSTPVCRKILSSTEVDEATELLTLSSAVGTELPLGAFVSFLLYCRLDTDTPVLRWHNATSGMVELPFIDLPVQTP